MAGAAGQLPTHISVARLQDCRDLASGHGIPQQGKQTQVKVLTIDTETRLVEFQSCSGTVPARTSRLNTVCNAYDAASNDSWPTLQRISVQT